MASQSDPPEPTPREPTPEEIWAERVRVPPRFVVIFTRQLSAMLRAGVPIIQGLDTLSHQAEAPNFGQIIRLMSEKLATGHRFSKALNDFPRVFPKIYVTMVQIGEQTGMLDACLDRLAGWQERDYQIYQKVKSALSYPIFVLCLAATLTLGLFYWVLPGFIDIFKDMNVPLPVITQIVVAVTNGVRNPGVWLISLAILGSGFTALRDYSRTRAGSLLLYRIALGIPLMGGMLRYGGLARYCGAVEALLGAGMDMPRAFKLAAGASGNPLFDDDVQNLVDFVMEGGMASEHMELRDDLYPGSLIQMVAAGEQASKLPDMFGRAAGYYDIEMNYQVEALSAALEPMLLAAVASVVGTIVLSIFLPMYSYIGKLGA